MAKTSLQTLYDQARRWIESNDPERAIGLTQYILEQYPNNLEAHVILGEAYLADRQLDKAQEAFQRVLRSDPEHIPAHVGLGITYERQGRLDRAVPEFEQAWEIKPDMAELRSQLLRLYADAWGTEHAQLRLSRAGLARLYAKGHMLPQAIAEFRHVIDDQPQRYDAKVALAEALWHNDQEEESLALCRQLLDDRADLLKANLLLGYMDLASGRSAGQHYWDAAHAMDPYDTVARAMFDTLPFSNGEAPSIEEWDEAEWERQRAQAQEELATATRPIPVPAVEAEAPSAVTRPPEPQRAHVPTRAADDDDFLAILLGAGAAGAAGAAAFDTTSDESAAPDTDASTPSIDDEDIALTPFSLSELGLSEDEITSLDEPGNVTDQAEAQHDAALGDQQDTLEIAAPAIDQDVPEPEATETQDASEMLSGKETQPFSLSELGLSDDDLSVDFGAPSTEPSVEASPFEGDTADADTLEAGLASGDIQPFSFNDLGLSEEEMALLGISQQQAETTEPELADSSAEMTAADETEAESMSEGLASGDIQPFSLRDLGLSEDEIASLDLEEGTPSAEAPPAHAETEHAPESVSEGLASGDIQPFSLRDLGLSEDEIASLDLGEGTPSDSSSSQDFDAADAGLTVKPFSLSDLGISDEEFDQLNTLGDTQPSVFGNADVGASDDDDEYALPSDLQPFSLDELDLSAPGGALLDASSGLPPSLQPFSLEDTIPPASVTPPPDRESSAHVDEDEDTTEEEETSQTGGYSWQEPSQRSQPSFISSMNKDDAGDNLSIFAKLKQRKQLEPSAADAQVPLSETQPDDRMLFSLDDVLLRVDETGTPEAPTEAETELSAPESAVSETSATPAADAEQGSISEAVAAGTIQPFSLSDLGLSDEEIAALGIGAGAAASKEPATEPEQTAPESMSEGLTSGDIQPFSLSDLGLSEDEIASLDLEEGPSSAEAPPAQAEHAPESVSEGLASGDIQPFSLSDLGLSEDEIASLDLEEGPPSAEAPPAQAEHAPESVSEGLASGDIQPFSLSDLGLSEEEIQSLGLGAMDEAEEKPFTLGAVGDDFADFAFAPAAAPSNDAETPTTSDSNIQPMVDQLVSRGQQQGFVDIADIIAALGDTQAAEEQVEEVIRQLQEADIQIRDGDEIIDLSAEEDVEDADALDFTAGTEQTDARETQPFSLADLGLADADVPASDDASQATPTAAPVEEPDEQQAASAQTRVGPAAPAISDAALAGGSPMLAAYVQRLENDPQNHRLRLSVARAVGQAGMADTAVQQYRHLIKQNALLDAVVDDIRDLIDEVEDVRFLQRLHRLLGDAYAKQGLIDEAMNEYSWVAQ